MEDSGRVKMTALCLFAVLSVITIANADILQQAESNVHRFEMTQDKELPVTHTIKKRSLRHKRDAGALDEKCQQQKQVFQNSLNAVGADKFMHRHTFANETKYTMSLVWAGENEGVILVSVTEEMYIFAKQSSLYRSDNSGKSFDDIIERIDHSIIRKDNGLQKHPFRPKKVLIVCHGQDSNSLLYITENGGIDFKKVLMPFVFKGQFMFHPDKGCPECYDFILAHDVDSKRLYLSKDGGYTWGAMGSERIKHFKWSTLEGDPHATVYATLDESPVTTHYFDISSLFDSSHQGNLKLAKSTDFGSTWSKVKDGVYSFGMQGKFLYTSVKSTDTERIMEVSTDGGKSWNEAQLPTVTEDRFYSILDMTEGLIFMHVDNPGDTGHGTLYTSDSSGVIFSKSLEKHLYPNYQDVTDFYKVESMRGVYLASQMEDDRSIHTMITFDRGGEWKMIKRPAGAPCKDESKPCYLQIANTYSMSRGVHAQPPFSTDNAIGIIMVHGHVAEALQTTPPDVYVTSDGGYTWNRALEGPHHLQIADHGGLLVAVPADTPYPKVVKFSTDEGRCWHEYKFTDKDVVFTGLLTEPGNKAATVGIWGYGKEDRVWVTHVIDFSTVINKQCGSLDYEDWIAHSDMNHEKDSRYHACLLGVKETFKRLKKDSWCINGYSHEVQKSEEVCPCSQDDYECDYGYYREENSYLCIRDKKFIKNELDICLHGHEERIVTKGYRKIPGDQCSGGFKPAGDEEVDIQKLCKEGDKSQIKSEIGQTSDTSPGPDRASVLVGVLVVVSVIIVFLLLFFIKKYNLLGRRTPAYKYSMLADSVEQDYDNDIENALATSTSLYEDASDDDTKRREQQPIKTRNTQSNGSVGTSNSINSTHQPGVRQYHDDSDDDLLA